MNHLLSSLFLFLLLTITSIEGADPIDSYIGEDTVFGLSTPLSATDGDPSGVVAGCVSVIDGIYFDTMTDLVIPGPAPIIFQRTFDSHSGRWQFHPGGYLCYQEGDFERPTWNGRQRIYPEHGRKLYAHVSGLGSHLVLWTKNPRHEKYAKTQGLMAIDEKRISKGYSNCAKGDIGGKTNISNYVFSYSNSTLTTGSGQKAYYSKDAKLKELFWLSSLEFPDHNRHFLEYHTGGRASKLEHYFCSKIKASDSTGATLYGSVSINSGKYMSQITSDDQRNVKYVYSTKVKSLFRPQILQAESSNGIPVKYHYDERKRLIKKEFPDGRSLHIGYKDHKPTCLYAPVGKDNTPLLTHQFEYNKRFTIVHEPYDRKTIYRYNDHHQLYQIEKRDDQGKLFHTENFAWNTSGDIQFYYLYNESSHLYTHQYTYDDCHNVIREAFAGTISGETTHQTIGDLGEEKFTQSYSYSKDDFNNLLTETDGIATIRYTYLPGTDLVSAKFVTDGVNILQRIFFTYDNTATLICRIIDDGKTQDPNNLSGVTQRTIYRISPKKQRPCLGLPEIEEMWYWDPSTQTEKFLGKKENTYSTEGWLTSQILTDAERREYYVIQKTYDRLGNILEETDPLGNITIRKYDDNGNKIYEKGPRQDTHQEFTYDFVNRLTSHTIVANGERLTTSYEYDMASRLIASTDPYGQTTKYEYNSLNQLTKKTFPALVDSQGNLIHPTESYTYDFFNNIATITDANGQIKTTTYNIYKQPLVETFPDGTTLRYYYNNNGTLKKEVTKTGMQIHYAYDALKRITSKKMYTPEGNFISEWKYTYSSFNKTSETDPNGNTTYYEYDGAGRLISGKNHNTQTLYTYDSLSRIAQKKENYGDDHWKITSYAYDKLHRITQQTIQDENEKLYLQTHYTYDESGNLIEEKQENSITRKNYDGLKRLVQMIDPLGHITTIDYDAHYQNEHGQTVRKETATDPLGRQKITIYDTHGHISIEELIYQGQTYAHHQNYYDPLGNHIQQTDTLYYQGIPEKTITTTWEYNTAQQIIKLTQAKDTQDQKITQYTYNSCGQQEKIIKPDKNILHKEYDFLGRLRKLYSSDHTIEEEYTYDLNSNLIKVKDYITGKTTEREYDHLNQIIRETLANDLTLIYQRDPLTRITNVQLPDLTEIHYTYDALHLRELSYDHFIHQYHYNPEGLLIEQNHIGQAGSTHYSHDLAHRLISINHPTWKQSDIAYDPIGNLTSYVLSDPEGLLETHFSYDPLNQLISEGPDLSYSYDSLHNRRLKNQTSHTLNDLHQLLSQGETQYTYDQNGNLISKEIDKSHTQYQYDALDRLICVIENDQKTTYTYDPFHRRLKRTKHKSQDHQWIPISEESFVYQGNAEIGIYQNNHFQELRILGVGQGDVGASILIRCDHHTFVPIHDQNGNICCLIDPLTGKPNETYRYTAFGEETLSQDPSSPWRFSSKRKDGNLIHFGYRDYDPEIGRWMTTDPLSYTDGPNLYAYVHNNPLTHIDPFGLAKINAQPGISVAKPDSVGGSKPPQESKESSLNSYETNTSEQPALSDSQYFTSSGVKGLYQGFVHPIDTLGKWIDGGKSLYSCCSSGNYSSLTNQFKAKSYREITAFGLETAGEVGGIVGTVYSGCAAVRGGLGLARMGASLLERRVVVTQSSRIAMEVLEVSSSTLPQVEVRVLPGITANGKYSFTKTVEGYLTETIQHGKNMGLLQRPYVRSPLTIQEILLSGKGVPDSSFKGGINWKVPGYFNKKAGIWELGMDPNTGVIYHYLFDGNKKESQ